MSIRANLISKHLGSVEAVDPEYVYVAPYLNQERYFTALQAFCGVQTYQLDSGRSFVHTHIQSVSMGRLAATRPPYIGVHHYFLSRYIFAWCVSKDWRHLLYPWNVASILFRIGKSGYSNASRKNQDKTLDKNTKEGASIWTTPTGVALADFHRHPEEDEHGIYGLWNVWTFSCDSGAILCMNLSFPSLSIQKRFTGLLALFSKYSLVRSLERKIVPA